MSQPVNLVCSTVYSMADVRYDTSAAKSITTVAYLTASDKFEEL